MKTLHSSEWYRACIGRDVHYRINEPTIALFQEEGKYIARTMTSGTIVEVPDALDGDRLVDVVWDGRGVMMFTQDLRSRAECLE